LDGKDVLLGKKKTGSLTPRQSRTVGLSGMVPAGIRLASYRVLACADATGAVRESREGNNCVASSGSTAVSARYDSTPFGPAEDVTVVPVLNESEGASVTEAVEAGAGGQLALTLPDGTQFTLDVPAGALTEDTTITMTALSDLTGQPFGAGAFVAGVRLTPAGLQFEKPASLEIVPATPLPPDLETSAVAESGGAGFHLQQVEVTPAAATFPLLHFTIVSLLRATDVQRTEQQARKAVDPQAALEQEVAAIYSEVRRRYFLEFDDGLLTDAEWARLVTIGKRYYDVVARPLLVDAANASKCANLAAKRRAVKAGISWARQMTLLGIDGLMGNRVDEMYNLIARVDAAKCVFPRTWSGPMSGSLTYGDMVETWSAEAVVFTKAGYNDQTVANYELTAGSIQWGVSGTDSNGCGWAGSATLAAAGSGSTNLTTVPASYRFRINRATFFATVTRSCPGQSSEQVGFMPLNADFGSTSDSTFTHTYQPGESPLAGNRTYNHSDTPDRTATLNWSLSAGS